jgi:hypothetical protein
MHIEEGNAVVAVAVNERSGLDLRQRLLGEMRNIELRQKYVATRTSEWAAADLRLAQERLLAVRMVRGVIGFALVGAAGGAIGDLILAKTAATRGAGALPLLVALGSAASGAVSFALLAAMGHVVVGEIVGEDKPCGRGGYGVWAIVGPIFDVGGEVMCGAIWGTICGLLIGVLSWVADAALGPFATVTAGAMGGALLGAIFCVLIAVVGMKRPSPKALEWAALGPLPVHAYLLSFRSARWRYLKK